MNQETYDEIMREKFMQMTNIDVAYQNEKYYLGDNDAETEWKDDPELASKLFVHTQAYKDFLNKDALLLLGRTGTGKTAILRQLENEKRSLLM